MRVEVVYSPSARVVESRSLELEDGATVATALRQSGYALPATVEPGSVGVWGRRCALEAVLRDGDRVEIYRPLRIDPKEARRQRGLRRRPRSLKAG